MAGSTLGTIFRITTWGESHGKSIGVVIDGCPSGIPLSEEDIQQYLDRRKPGQNRYTTKRKENDLVEILSGVLEGKTTGTPISLLVRNEDHHSNDYKDIASCFRPGHADYTFWNKYGIRDASGGGRSSGRETIGRVAAGAVAMKILKSLHIDIMAYTKSIGPIVVPEEKYNYNDIFENPLSMPNNDYAKEASCYLDKCLSDKDSSGGVIECIVKHLPVGLGEPVFEKLDANLAKAMLSIGAVKAFEIGDGFQAAFAKGSEHNDAFCGKDGAIYKETNHSGGVLGGMSDGSDVVFRIAIKPTPSISKEQHTTTIAGENRLLSIHGRHDPIIVPRAIVVVEAMAALTILDLLLLNMSSRFEAIRSFYIPEDDRKDLS